MSEKLSEEKIANIREMKMKGAPLVVIRNEVSVSNFIINKCCKDLAIVKDSESKSKIPCNKFSFDELSEEDKRRYNSCKPPSKEKESKTFVTGSKGEYWKAAIFEDSRRGYQNMKGEV
jgi:hypothetical protein